MKYLLLTCLMVLGVTAYTSAQGLQVGDQAPDFSLLNVDGNKVSLADMNDVSGYIVVFTCNHCPFSVAYEARLIELHKTYAPKGYPVVAINPNDPEVQPADSYEAMVARAAEKAFPFVYLFDEGQEVYPQYGATRTPHVFLLDNQQIVRYIGAIDDNHADPLGVEQPFLKNALEAMLKGQAVEPSITKAIGCSIKKQS